MAKQTNSHQSRAPLDEFVDALLGAGAVLSQIINHMVRSASSGQSAPDAAPIPDVAHSLLRDVLAELHHRYCEQDLEVAADLVADATEMIADNIFMLPLEETG